MHCTSLFSSILEGSLLPCCCDAVASTVTVGMDGLISYPEIWSLKASVRRIAACACLCKFSASLAGVLLTFAFFPCFDQEHGKGTNNYSQHLYILSCSEYLQYHIYSLGVKFLQNSY